MMYLTDREDLRPVLPAIARPMENCEDALLAQLDAQADNVSDQIPQDYREAYQNWYRDLTEV